MTQRRNRSLRVYVAAPWAHKMEAKKATERLKSEGFTVTSRWTDYPDSPDHTYDPPQLRREAQNDWADIFHSDVMVVLNLTMSEGKATEQGLALARGIPIIGVGKPEHNVFHYLPAYTWVETIGQAVEELEDMVY